MRSIEARAVVLVALLGTMVVVCLAAGVVLALRAAVLGDAGASARAVADAADRGYYAKRITELGVGVTGVAWIWWQQQFVRNVRALGRPTGPSPAWATFGWLIPVVNLVVPQFQLGVSAESSDPSDDPSPPKALYAWWLASVGAFALVVIGGQVRPPEHELGPERLAEFQAADRIHSLAMVVAAAAAVLGILTVRACTHRHVRLIAQLQRPTAG